MSQRCNFCYLFNVGLAVNCSNLLRRHGRDTVSELATGRVRVAAATGFGWPLEHRNQLRGRGPTLIALRSARRGERHARAARSQSKSLGSPNVMGGKMDFGQRK